jgi:hypothetical protein
MCCLWDNVKKYFRTGQDTDDNIIRRILIACWITNATDTHSEYVILIAFFTATMVTRTRPNVTLYVHCLSFWLCEYLRQSSRQLSQIP